MSTTVIEVGNKSVLLVDCSQKTPDDIDDLKQTLQAARELLLDAPEKSAYIITDMTQSKFNPELVSLFSEFTSSNKSVVRESVLVGLSEHHKVILSIFKKLHKREFRVVDTLEEAKSYLMSVE